MYTLEFLDCMVRTPNSKIKAHPQSLIGSLLYYTYPNRVRELELQELHGFKSTPSNQSNRQDPVYSNYSFTMELLN